MAYNYPMIPLKLETLLSGRVVEQDRVEYKKGWNPAETIHTICAYANDFQNVNGGYIAIGIEAENGIPKSPPSGLKKEKLDQIQQELFQYCNTIEPRYIPRVEVIEYQGEWVIYLWAPAGDYGPYKAPKDVLSKRKDEKIKEYWIKTFSLKTAAKGNELNDLFEKFASVPWDDRVNSDAKLEDISRLYVEDYLQRSDSALYGQRNTMSLEDMLVALEVAKFTDVGIDIRNIGLLMFNDKPHKFIPETKIELVHFHSTDAEESDDFTEIEYTGPIQKQIQEALSYIKSVMVIEKVVKHPDRAEADRFFTYPYAAVEEALVNAVFHKSYKINAPVSVRIYSNRIMIINYPGPESWIDMDKLRAGKEVSRRYRNSRIGEFLKGLDLSEKQSTGITKIIGALKRNGSPAVEFETDAERQYMITTLYMHKSFKAEEVSSNRQIIEERGATYSEDLTENLTENLTEKEINVLHLIFENRNLTTSEMAERLGITRQTISSRIKTLKEKKVIKRIGSDTKGYWEIIR